MHPRAAAFILRKSSTISGSRKAASLHTRHHSACPRSYLGVTLTVLFSIAKLDFSYSCARVQLRCCFQQVPPLLARRVISASALCRRIVRGWLDTFPTLICCMRTATSPTHCCHRSSFSRRICSRHYHHRVATGCAPRLTLCSSFLASAGHYRWHSFGSSAISSTSSIKLPLRLFGLSCSIFSGRVD